MINIDDYIPGTQYIELARSDFADIGRFDDYLRFLRLPLDRNAMRIKVGTEQTAKLIKQLKGENEELKETLNQMRFRT